jgi:hypothetical protein
MLDHNGFGCEGMKLLSDGLRRNPHLKGTHNKNYL